MFIRIMFMVCNTISFLHIEISQKCLFLAIGWCVYGFGVLQLPLWGFYAIWKEFGYSFREKIKSAFMPQSAWGPEDTKIFQDYQESIIDYNHKLKKETNVIKIVLARIFK